MIPTLSQPPPPSATSLPRLPPKPFPRSKFILPPGDPAITTLVIGSSLVRGVRLPGKKSGTICYPGARIHSLSRILPEVLVQYPHLDRIIFHVGSNDVMERDFRPLRERYLSLFSHVPPHINITVSGPLPTHGEYPAQREKRRRLLVVHSWLKDLCENKGFGYADNFSMFYRKPYLFKRDGLHLWASGARLLARNMEASLRITNPYPHSSA